MIPEFRTESQVLNLIYEEVAGTPVIRTRLVGLAAGDGTGAIGAVMIQDRATDRRADVIEEPALPYPEYSLRSSLSSKTIRRLVSSQFTLSGTHDLVTSDLSLEFKTSDDGTMFFSFPHRIQTMMLSFATDELKTITFRVQYPERLPGFDGFLIKPFLQDTENTPEKEFSLWNDPIELSPGSFLSLHVTKTASSNLLRYYFVIQAVVES